MLNFFIPVPELIFYGIVILFVIARYHYLREKEGVSDHEDWILPGFKVYDLLLEKEMPYYAAMSMDGRQKFVARLRNIRSELEFQGREDFEITEEVEVLISASITQLTYGYSSPQIPILKGVVIFPDIFYSKLIDNWVKGLTMGNGVVFLSWKDFKEGYQFSTSTYNLGLHEFAHVLRLQAAEQGFEDERLSFYFDDWEENGTEIFNDIREGDQDFFREYGGSNRAEFFSVCVENFFEVPARFEEKLPELYWHLCFLLKQNPLNASEDYSFDSEDAKMVNTELREKVPVFDIYLSDFEFRFYHILKSLWVVPLILSINLITQIKSEEELIAWGRMFVVALLIGLSVRIHFFQSLKSILTREYISHFMLRSLPITLVLALIYKVIFC